MAYINVRAYGFRNYETKLFRVSENVTRPQKSFLHVAEYLRHVMEARFDSQGRRGGGSWKKISASWRARKAQLGLDPRILHATLRLRRSLTQQGHADQVVITRRHELLFGTDVPYAAVQDRKRPILKLTPGDRRELAKTITDEFVSPFRYRGKRL